MNNNQALITDDLRLHEAWTLKVQARNAATIAVTDSTDPLKGVWGCLNANQVTRCRCWESVCPAVLSLLFCLLSPVGPQHWTKPPGCTIWVWLTLSLLERWTEHCSTLLCRFPSRGKVYLTSIIQLSGCSCPCRAPVEPQSVLTQCRERNSLLTLRPSCYLDRVPITLRLYVRVRSPEKDSWDSSVAGSDTHDNGDKASEGGGWHRP